MYIYIYIYIYREVFFNECGRPQPIVLSHMDPYVIKSGNDSEFIYEKSNGKMKKYETNEKVMKKISRRRRREAGLVSLGNGQVQNPSRAGAA